MEAIKRLVRIDQKTALREYLGSTIMRSRIAVG
jgi:hypothetical protein